MTGLSFDILRRLADGEFHSGAALARELGVSRGTVWNAVREIDAAGISVYRLRGRGYKLDRALSLLDAAAIAHHAGSARERCLIEVVQRAGSTSSMLLEKAALGAPAGTVLAAEWQQSGRGRMGRSWHAEPGAALTFSVLWRFAQGAGALAGLSLAAGVALIRALDALGAREARLKWPNDVLAGGRKLAGILIEMQGDALGPSLAVIGIGMNVRLSRAIRGRIGQPATDLETVCGCAIDRNRVLGVVLANLVEVLDCFSGEGFAPFRREWDARHAYQERHVEVTLPAGALQRGLALGAADDGALLLQSGPDVLRLHSGELSLRATSDTARPGIRGPSRVRSGS